MKEITNFPEGYMEDKELTGRSLITPISTWNGRRQQEVPDVTDGGSSRTWSRRSPAASPRKDDHPLVIHASQAPFLRRSELLTAPLLPPAAAEAELLRRQLALFVPTGHGDNGCRSASP
jgi:hypothetical protein